MDYFILSYIGGALGRMHNGYKLNIWLRSNGSVVVAIFKIKIKNK